MSRQLRRRTSGYTLLELVFVLALIVMLAALAWPEYRGWTASRQLAGAGEMVRGVLRDARRQAAADGLPYCFEYRPGTGQFRVRPVRLRDEEDRPHIGVPALSPATGRGREPIENRAGTTIAEFELDGLVQFVESGQLPANEREASQPARLEAVPPMLPESKGIEEWRRLTEFYPDGSALDASIHLINPTGQSITLEVAGLTGEVEISDLQNFEEAESHERPTE